MKFTEAEWNELLMNGLPIGKCRVALTEIHRRKLQLDISKLSEVELNELLGNGLSIGKCDFA